jgi:hypothetical protein
VNPLGFLRRLFSRKKDRQKKKGDDPGYLACPVVASELKRGKFDSPREEKRIGPEEAVGETGEGQGAGSD